MIMIDYPRQARLKILGHIEIFEGVEATEWIQRVRMPNYDAVIERVFVIHLEAFDWNCPQHITPRYTPEEIREGMRSVETQMENLEEENKRMRAEISRLTSAQHRASSALK
jgi:uncharacterized protein